MNASLPILGHKFIEKGILKIMVEMINYYFQGIQVSTWCACKFTKIFHYNFISKVLQLTKY